ncbi:iron-hydroxamate ABC transporter substrate-binding protein [Halobacillus kuroshimensis]|uniref:Iron-hydroxamate ABC transporter substrate-binding protein n=1 Tax=Halobacillus kuroshimensis TaxID=302481 RepID=A0ABS3DU78_9BACI|nr:iron-hydroxamate ABC transporter substrate-binding protein [Halobacillus kuroshimensis]MBN8234865.1 iron-hydroxamate ABC transporter substrate-binding protein [Halobacillus kuroshimensis]
MKNIWLIGLLSLLLILSACGGGETENENTGNESEDDTQTEETSSDSETRMYESENGEIEVPADPERVVVLSSFAGNVLALDTNIVGVDAWSKGNPLFEEDLADAEELSDESLEKIIELDPDLIIGLANTKNTEKLNEIAPTVTYTYGKLDYLEQHVEIGKLLNKEEEAQQWVDEFKEKAGEAGTEIKNEIGEDATVTVFEEFDKQLYVFGDNWARGTEILYQEMELKMPEKVKEMALEDGFYAISPEVLSDYAGDYMIFSKSDGADSSFQETETYKNIPAVENDQVFEADAEAFYFNDPISLEHQLSFFQEKFLNE